MSEVRMIDVGDIHLADLNEERRRRVLVVSIARFHRAADRVLIAPETLGPPDDVPFPWRVAVDGAVFAVDFLRTIPLDTLFHQGYIDLRYLMEFYDRFPDKDRFFLSNGFFDLLAGTPTLRRWIEMGCTEEEIVAHWQWDLAIFRDIRRKYLLYPE